MSRNRLWLGEGRPVEERECSEGREFQAICVSGQLTGWCKQCAHFISLSRRAVLESPVLGTGFLYCYSVVCVASAPKAA